MDKISESLLILDHIGRIIKSRTDYCKRHIPFNILEEIGKRMDEYIKLGYNPKDLGEGEIAHKISRECSDIKITLHNYTRLNIIDMYSFNDEYNNFFIEINTINLNLKARIRKVRKKNKPLRNKLDWNQLIRFRNVVMAHNLRDKKESNRLSIKILKEINELMLDNEKGAKYADIVIEMFENIKLEFQTEIKEANNEFIEIAKRID